MLSSVATPASSEWLPLEESSEDDDFSVLLGLLGLMQFLENIQENCEYVNQIQKNTG